MVEPCPGLCEGDAGNPAHDPPGGCPVHQRLQHPTHKETGGSWACWVWPWGGRGVREQPSIAAQAGVEGMDEAKPFSAATGEAMRGPGPRSQPRFEIGCGETFFPQAGSQGGGGSPSGGGSGLRWAKPGAFLHYSVPGLNSRRSPGTAAWVSTNTPGMPILHPWELAAPNAPEPGHRSTIPPR